GLDEGWRRLLGARLVGIARELLAALDIEVVGRGEHGHSRYLAIGEGRDERRRTEQRRLLLLGLCLRHDHSPQCRRSPLRKPPSAIQRSTASSKRSASGPVMRSKGASGPSPVPQGISGGFQAYLDTHRSPLRGSRRPMTISVRGGAQATKTRPSSSASSRLKRSVTASLPRVRAACFLVLGMIHPARV